MYLRKTEAELAVLYEQFLESEKTGIIPDNELGKIRDQYSEMLLSNMIFVIVQDLTHTISDMWYEKFKRGEWKQFNEAPI